MWPAIVKELGKFLIAKILKYLFGWFGLQEKINKSNNQIEQEFQAVAKAKQDLKDALAAGRPKEEILKLTKVLKDANARFSSNFY